VAKNRQNNGQMCNNAGENNNGNNCNGNSTGNMQNNAGKAMKKKNRSKSNAGENPQ